jgi:hypothetical protein
MYVMLLALHGQKVRTGPCRLECGEDVCVVPYCVPVVFCERVC